MSRMLLVPVALLMTLSCGKKSDDAVVAVATFADVSKIMAASCLGSACHTSGANTSTTCGKFTESEALYKAAQACKTTANTPAARLNLTKGATSPDLFMPTTGTISAADKATLVNFK